MPKEELPRERLVRFGEQVLSVQELLQLILGRGISGESVALTAQKLLAHFGNLQKLAEARIDELSEIKGIGLAKASQIKAVFEISRRLSIQTLPYKKRDLTNPQKVQQLIKSRLKDYHKEHFYIVTLNTRGWSVAEVSIGTLDSAIVHPREVFIEAIKNRAYSVIFAHNHPSGDPEPSDEDHKTTDRLIQAGALLGISVSDHIIVTQEKVFSFRESGLLQEYEQSGK